MLEILAFVIALLGSSIAAAWDLKTTEIPDWIPHVMIASGLLINGLQSYLLWSYWPLLTSCIVGLGFLGFGFLMYHFGQWGGGDVKILSAIGFLLPTAPSFASASFFSFPFPLDIFKFSISYLFNVFLFGAVYMLVYALAIALMNKGVISEFTRDVKASSKLIIASSAFLFIALIAVGIYMTGMFNLHGNTLSVFINSAVPLVLTISLFFVWKFVKAVENVGFKKRISVRELKVGDVLLESKVWEGITEKELRKLKRSGKRYVIIKEGVRFAPAFPIALLITVLFGDALLLFMKFFV